MALILLAATAAAMSATLLWNPFDHGARATIALLPGLTVETGPSPHDGLIVTSLQSNSEAARSGIVVGDDVQRLDGRAIRRLDEAVAYLRRDRNPEIVLGVARGQTRRNVRLHRGKEFGHGA